MNSNQRFRRLPIIVERLIVRIYPDRGRYTSLGDFREEYHDCRMDKGALYAHVWIWRQIFLSLPGFFRNRLYWSRIMFKNYLTIAIRSLSKDKVFSLINILGLSVGIAGAVLIFLFSRSELSYDRFHQNAGRIFRVYTDFYAPDGGLDLRSRGVALPVGPVLEESFPEIEASVRVHSKSSVLKSGENLYSEPITMVDQSFFRVFSFPLTLGSPDTVFSQPYSMVITESLAKKYFGGTSPLGKTLTLINGKERSDFIITGMAAPPPSNSSIRFRILIDMQSAEALKLETNFTNWEAFGWQNYVLTTSADSPQKINQRMEPFIRDHFALMIEKAKQKKQWTGDGVPLNLGFQNISKVHLDPGAKGSPNLNAIFILTGIAAIVLFIAGINFVNISLGKAASRSLEVGMRKVLGARRKQLIHQFWGESLLTTGLAFLTGLILASAALPTFNRLAQKDLNMGTIFQMPDMVLLLGSGLVIGILAGSYPALVLSGFRPADIFQKKLRLGGKGFLTRALVVLQFTLSVFLLISAFILSGQLRFMQHHDPGFSRQGVIILPTQEPDASSSRQILKAFRDRLQQNPLVTSLSGTHWRFDDAFAYPIKKDGRKIDVIQNHIDYDYFKTLNIKIIQGRSFSPEFPSDLRGVVVNEKLLKELEINNPIGQLLRGYYKRLTIIGVVKDYHFENLRREILPTIHYINPSLAVKYILAKVPTAQLSASLTLLDQTWKEIQPDKPFLYSFLDDDLKALYNDEQRWGAIVGCATALAVFIACLGILGLTSIAVSKRTKEIGIRKVMGAGELRIIRMIIREFLLLVGIANLLAWPFAYFLLQEFLNNYHYRIPIGPQYFILAGFLSLLVAGLVSIALASKAAAANPAMTLRYE